LRINDSGQRLYPLAFLRRQIGASAVRSFSGQADAFAQRGVRVDGGANVQRIRAHFDGQRHFSEQARQRGNLDAIALSLAMAGGIEGKSQLM